MQLPDIAGPEDGLLGWLKWAAVVGPTLLAAFVLVRTKTASIWKDERDAALAKADRLAEENRELELRLAEQGKELAECRAKTDLKALMDQSREFQLEIVGALTKVASASDGRYERTLAALERHVSLFDGILQRIDEQGNLLRLMTTTLQGMEARLDAGERSG